MKADQPFSPVTIILETPEEAWVMLNLLGMADSDTIHDWFCHPDTGGGNWQKIQHLREQMCIELEATLRAQGEWTELTPKGLQNDG